MRLNTIKTRFIRYPVKRAAGIMSTLRPEYLNLAISIRFCPNNLG